MKLKLRIYDSSSRKMLYAREPDEQGKRDYYPFLFGIGFSHWSTADLSEPMVWIGRIDERGVEIYEGDILGLDDPEDTSRAVVVFHKGAFKPQLLVNRERPLYDDLFDDWIVIGNRYEHPELLAKVGE